jgi:SWI/SNF related-matrix-associated actin-dependent regulator of chromatin subfamily C
VTADTPRGLQPFQPAPNPVATSGKPHPSTDRATSATPAPKADLNLEIRRNIYDDKGKDISQGEDQAKQANGEAATANGVSREGSTKAMDSAAKVPKKAFNCYSCGIDCTRLRFHYAKSAPVSTNPSAEIKYDLCPNCFLQGRLPSSHQASDFVKLEDAPQTVIPDRDAPWSDSETLLLLEGLENFDDNWQQIADHVGTRTREECVMKFLQMEIEDKYLDGPEGGSATMRALNGREPISQLENPVLSVVSFLGEMSQPAVAAAAAGRTVAEVRHELESQLNNGIKKGKAVTEGDQSKGKNKESDSVKPEDSMDVDSNMQEADSTVAVRGASTEQLPKASISTVALAAGAGRAGVLASNEEREMTRLVSAAVNTTLQKFEVKLSQFTEMEEIVEAERRELEQARQQLFLDRMAFKKRVKEVQDALQAASLKSPGEEADTMAADAANAGLGNQFGFQPPNADPRTGVQPLSSEPGADFKTFEL